MWSVHQRLAELWHIHSNDRELTDEEKTDFKHCLDANLNKAWKLADLFNESLVASISEDDNWNLEICAKIDEIKDVLIGHK